MKYIITVLTLSLMFTAAFAKDAKEASSLQAQNKAQNAATTQKLDSAAKESPQKAAPKMDAKDTESAAIIANFTAWDKKLKSLKVDYAQQTSFEDIAISSSNGRLYKQDNNIRLDTLEGERVTQKAVTDKKIIKIFDDKGKQVTTLGWQEWAASQPNKALFDFGNYGSVVKSHKVTKAAKTQDGYVLKLTSQGSEGQYTLDFELGQDYFPKTITVSGEGVSTKTVLTSVSKNPEIQESVFK